MSSCIRHIEQKLVWLFLWLFRDLDVGSGFVALMTCFSN